MFCARACLWFVFGYFLAVCFCACVGFVVCFWLLFCLAERFGFFGLLGVSVVVNLLVLSMVYVRDFRAVRWACVLGGCCVVYCAGHWFGGGFGVAACFWVWVRVRDFGLIALVVVWPYCFCGS